MSEIAEPTWLWPAVACGAMTVVLHAVDLAQRSRWTLPAGRLRS